MTISFVATSEAAGGTQSEPSGVQPGDMLFCVINGASAPAGPAGWSKVGADRTGSGETTNVWWIARGSTAPSYTWTNSPDGGSISAFRGAQTTLHASGQSAAGSTVSPSVATTVDDCLMVLLYGDNGSSTIGAPSGCTLRNSGFFVGCASVAQATAGSTPTRTWTSTSLPIGAWTVALAPLGLAPPPFTVVQKPLRSWRL